MIHVINARVHGAHYNIIIIIMCTILHVIYVFICSGDYPVIVPPIRDVYRPVILLLS